jgi:hypothetical protein
VSQVKAKVLRPFRVQVQQDGAKETTRRFKAGERIDCTQEQLEVGRAAGLLEEENTPEE